MAMKDHRPEVVAESAPDASELLRNEEKAGCAEVRRQARGLSHHQVKVALKKARCRLLENTGDGGEPPQTGRARAEVEEWRRIAQLLADEAGPYDPDTDAFIQGELAGEADRAAERSPWRRA